MRCNCAWLLLLWVGCDQGEPPFDELPLRDALRADPAVLAPLSEVSRARLASRLESARTGDVAVDHLSVDSSASPQTVIGDVDRARQRRQAEPLLLGVVRGDAAWPIEGESDRPGNALPSLGGVLATATADVEARALAGHAGVELRILMAATGAQRLERVVGWPSGAVAIEDTIYVNAAWLVALAPAERRNLDGGLPSESPGSPSSGAATTTAVPLSPGKPPSSVENVTGAISDTPAPGFDADAGAPPTRRTEPSEPSEPSKPVSTDTCDDGCADSCASSDGQSCAGADSGDDGDYTGSDSGCEPPSEDTSGDASDDCASSDESSGDACASSDPGEMDSSGCQIGPHPRHKKSDPSAWLLAPLGYLFYRRRP